MSVGITAVEFMKGDFVWTFGAGASIPTDQTKGTSAAVSYSASGKTSATLQLTVSTKTGVQTGTIQCQPLQVNGDPITGCKCTTAAASVDYTATPDVVWSVTGCTSASMPLTYNWNGTDGTETFSNSFTAATASYAPTLKVGNSDNTVIDVTCPAVKVTEGAEYEIKVSQDKVELPGPGTYAVVTKGGTGLTACRVSCNANGALTVKVNGKTFTGSYYVNFEGIDTSWCNMTLDFDISAAATCEASWN